MLSKVNGANFLGKDETQSVFGQTVALCFFSLMVGRDDQWSCLEYHMLDPVSTFTVSWQANRRAHQELDGEVPLSETFVQVTTLDTMMPEGFCTPWISSQEREGNVLRRFVWWFSHLPRKDCGPARADWVPRQGVGIHLSHFFFGRVNGAQTEEQEVSNEASFRLIELRMTDTNSLSDIHSTRAPRKKQVQIFPATTFVCDPSMWWWLFFLFCTSICAHLKKSKNTC